MNVTTDELSTWCLECGTTLDAIAPGWVRCPRCGWEEFKAGVSKVADLELQQRHRDEARECYEEEVVKIPLTKRRSGGRSGRRYKEEKKWWQPWYVRGT